MSGAATVPPGGAAPPRRPRRVLLVAFHYPPLKGSSGLQRTLKFSRYLPEHGWEPVVLTAHPRSYPSVSDELLDAIPSGIVVERAFAHDTSRHLRILGRYPRLLALPDRWVTWWAGAVTAGLRLVRRHRPDAIWSTFPIATAHLIGLTLHRLTGVPWIADFRDSMTEDGYPHDPLVRRTYRAIEGRAVAQSAAAVFTTQGARRMYSARYPDVPPARWHVIANGYDEEEFAAAERLVDPRGHGRGRIVLVHSGILYPSERDPRPFFRALRQLTDSGDLARGRLEVILRATGHDDAYRDEIRAAGLDEIVRLEPALPYRRALAEMLEADGLLLFQASSCNHQIPAKLYEYVRARRPILALTDPEGDTARTLLDLGIDTVAPLDRSDAIGDALRSFLAAIDARSFSPPDDVRISALSRRGRTAEFAHLLDAITGSRAETGAAPTETCAPQAEHAAAP